MSYPDKKINVLVVDDHQLIIDGLHVLLRDEPSINISGGVLSGTQALEFIQENKVDVVLADINMPGMSGIELTRRIKGDFPHTAVIGLTMNSEGSLINEMVEAGAEGYVLKNTHISELCDAIYSVACGRSYISSEVQDIIRKNKRKAVQPKTPDCNTILTSRETEILNLLALGINVETISERLMIAKRTVETHRRNIFLKTRTKSVVGLIQYGIEKNLISSDYQ